MPLFNTCYGVKIKLKMWEIEVQNRRQNFKYKFDCTTTYDVRKNGKLFCLNSQKCSAKYF